MTDSADGPRRDASSAEVRRRLAAELSLPSRVGHTALLLAGLAAATVAAALLLTEAGLPARTRIAFVVMVIIGLAWAGFALWVLVRRRVLFATHRVIATRMAAAFTALFTAGALLAVFDWGAGAAGLFAAIVGAAMMSVALLLHVRARRRVRELTARRRELEREIADAERVR
jgi:hypothetical protein